MVTTGEPVQNPAYRRTRIRFRASLTGPGSAFRPGRTLPTLGATIARSLREFAPRLVTHVCATFSGVYSLAHRDRRRAGPDGVDRDPMAATTRLRRVTSRLVVSVLLGAGVASCTSGFIMGGGPLGVPRASGDSGELCVSVDESRRITIGYEVLDNAGSTTVAILDARLSDPTTGLTLLEARVVAIDVVSGGGDLVGVVEFPAPRSSGQEWSEVIGSGDVWVPARSSERVWNLVVGLELQPGTSAGHASGLTLMYGIGDAIFVWESSNTIEVRDSWCS